MYNIHDRLCISYTKHSSRVYINAKLRSGCLVGDPVSGILTTSLPHAAPGSRNHYPRHFNNYRAARLPAAAVGRARVRALCARGLIGRRGDWAPAGQDDLALPTRSAPASAAAEPKLPGGTAARGQWRIRGAGAVLQDPEL